MSELFEHPPQTIADSGAISVRPSDILRSRVGQAELGSASEGFERVTQIDNELAHSRAEVARLTALLNTPELDDFAKAVPLEAAHQRERWGAQHDTGKEPEDWFWVVGYLAGKALRSHIEGNAEKAKHHTITCAAVLANWHARIIQDSRGVSLNRGKND